MWHDVRGSRMRVRADLALRVAWDMLRIPLLHRDVRPATAAERAGMPASVAASASDRGKEA